MSIPRNKVRTFSGNSGPDNLFPYCFQLWLFQQHLQNFLSEQVVNVRKWNVSIVLP